MNYSNTTIEVVENINMFIYSTVYYSTINKHIYSTMYYELIRNSVFNVRFTSVIINIVHVLLISQCSYLKSSDI